MNLEIGNLVTGIIVVVLGALILVDGVVALGPLVLVDGVLVNEPGSAMFFGSTNPAFMLAVGLIALMMGGSLLQAATKKKLVPPV